MPVDEMLHLSITERMKNVVITPPKDVEKVDLSRIYRLTP
jgi:hypothetical protein